MKVRTTISGVLGIISFSSALLSSGVKETADWFVYAKPFILFAIITGLISFIVYKWDSIRRVTYPATVCLWAWLYERGVIDTQFGKDTYRVYKHLGKSYRRFYTKVQQAFDYYREHAEVAN